MLLIKFKKKKVSRGSINHQGFILSAKHSILQSNFKVLSLFATLQGLLDTGSLSIQCYRQLLPQLYWIHLKYWLLVMHLLTQQRKSWCSRMWCTEFIKEKGFRDFTKDTWHRYFITVFMHCAGCLCTRW